MIQHHSLFKAPYILSKTLNTLLDRFSFRFLSNKIEIADWGLLQFAGGLHLLIGLWSSNELCLMNMGEKNGSERIERVSSFSGQPRSIISAYLEQEVILVGTLDGIVHAFEIKVWFVVSTWKISAKKTWNKA